MEYAQALFLWLIFSVFCGSFPTTLAFSVPTANSAASISMTTPYPGASAIQLSTGVDQMTTPSLTTLKSGSAPDKTSPVTTFQTNGLMTSTGTSTSREQNETSAIVIAMLVILGLVCLALIVFVVILGYFVRRQRKEMNNMNNTLAALDCHVKMHLALTTDSQPKEEFGSSANEPVLPIKKRKKSAPGFLEGRSTNEHIYSKQPSNVQRKPSLPATLPHIPLPPIPLPDIPEDEPLSRNIIYALPPLPESNTSRTKKTLHIPPFKPPPVAQGRTQENEYLNQVNNTSNRKKETTKQDLHVKDTRDDDDYLNTETLRRSDTSNKENVNLRELSWEREEEETTINEPVYGNNGVVTSNRW